ncbi:sensor histidine kinase [Parasegetibacter sp. NRK P23]|uniref:tetratricopeptide repeat-containing sensor histidine kinase n=1 Tax=Parasegetibacter sp. NRK P23 TaxID=2942999 RepID=UPI00204331C1|nr:sensor histidine kinase [Parasegetibacter sp. NRK P23]MCM5529112.1 sensor histidine kinase [Parasegetibacter sp. NRK P23]
MNQRGVLCLTIVWMLLSPVFAQSPVATDSLKEVLLQQKNYQAKVSLLRDYLKKIYLTQYDETIALSRIGLDLARTEDDKAASGDFLRMIGGAFIKKGNIDTGSVYYYKALAALENTGDNERLGLLYDDMARMYRKLRQPKRALEFYEKALAIYEAGNNQEGIARINNESGVVYRDEGNYAEAKKRFEKSLNIQRLRNDSVGIGYSLEFLGYNQLMVKEYGEAERYLRQALAIRESLPDDFALMLNYTALGEFYKETGKYKLSNDYFEKSNAVARKIKFTDIQKYNYEQITGNFEQLGDFEKAFQSLRLYNVLNDSLYSARKLKDVEEISAKYETAEKEKQLFEQRTRIAENELRLKTRNLWIFALSAFTLIMALIGFLIFKQQTLKNLKQQQEAEMKLAMERIGSQNRLQEQRIAIARDLHDNIGAQLSFIISTIDAIKYHVHQADARVVDKLNNISAFAKETIRELRDTIWAMNKSAITVRDLRGRTLNFIEKAKQSQDRTTITLSIGEDVAEDAVFSGIQGLNIFRIVQEATNNAMKYAEAGNIHISIGKTDNDFLFEVRDDGKGFKEAGTAEGNGLLNMRKRAQELGRELLLESGAERGTKVSFRVPQNSSTA